MGAWLRVGGLGLLALGGFVWLGLVGELGFFDGGEEFDGVDGFVEEGDVGAVAVESCEAGSCGEEDDAGLGGVFLEEEGPFVAAEAGEVDIDDGDVGGSALGEPGLGFEGVGGGEDGVAVGGEEVREGAAGAGFVFEDKDAFFHV